MDWPLPHSLLCGWRHLAFTIGVSLRQACVGRDSSGQLPKEEADSHGDITIYLGLPGWGRHEMAASLAFMEGHSPDMNLLAFQRTGEVNRIGRDSPHLICSLT